MLLRILRMLLELRMLLRMVLPSGFLLVLRMLLRKVGGGTNTFPPLL
jgi:hypothetical protein